MDNIAHALVGAALGRAIADRHVPAAAVIGGIAANLPDIAEIFTGYFGWSRPERLLNHRGITHSLVGALVEIVAVTLIVGWAVRRQPAKPPWRWITTLVAITLLSHLFMDWQGSYGWRPFLPWNATWYYLDWVAIADPFFWILPLLVLAWGADRHWLPLSAVVITGGLVVLIIAQYLRTGGRVSGWVLPLCALMAIVGAIGWIQFWFGPVLRQRIATLGIVILAVYSVAQGIAVQDRKREIARQAMHRFGATATWAALTNIGAPFTWDGMYASSDTVVGEHWQVPRNLTNPAVARVLRETADGRAIAQFARFLTARVEPSDSVVDVWDSRYARGPGDGWTVVRIRRW
ncbi:MAG TPA: metal-dependent hydrolase [Gemmatimonadales bacterium]|nr:metal-dependent hydrolase [Gemmatimonadales bacterium]